MSRFLDNKFGKLVEYVPGEQPQDKKYIKLNTNESPFPVSDGVLRAINSKEVKDLRLYSDPDCKILKSKLSSLFNVELQNVFLSNGSDDILNFAFMAFAENGAVFPDISYGFYSVFADLNRTKADIKPLKEDFTIDISDYCNQNKLIVIANPNAPTGITLSVSEIEKIIKSNPDNVVLIDEAYVDFGAESCYPLTRKYNNLLVVQTFSKSRSMAGARLGFAIASKEIIADLEKIKYSTNPYNINRLTQVAGAAALDENEYYMNNCKEIILVREQVIKELRRLGFYVTDSKANFIFARSEKIGGAELYRKLKEQGILVRHFEKERIRDYNRITVGSLEEMEVFLEKVKEIIGGQNDEKGRN